jgi:hypothetical protein
VSGCGKQKTLQDECGKERERSRRFLLIAYVSHSNSLSAPAGRHCAFVSVWAETVFNTTLQTQKWLTAYLLSGSS